MSDSTTTGGRVLLVVLAVAAVAVVAWLTLAGPLSGSRSVKRDDEGLTRGAMRGEEVPGEGGEDSGDDEGGLVGRYDASELGSLRLRLLDVNGRVPIIDETVLLAARTGREVRVVTDNLGVASFAGVAPGRGYRIEIAAEGYASVTIQGVPIRSRRLTDLGDHLLGQNIVLRGRVVDGLGRGLAGAAVAVFTPHRGILADGIFFSMVDQATSIPDPVERALTDEAGWFTMSSLTNGSYRLEAHLAGYATRYETDVVVSQERPARHMTIVLGEGATARGRVRTEDGRPIGGALVAALRDPGRRFFTSTTVERDLVNTDSEGRYVMDTLTQGQSYRFGVMADGYAPLFEMGATEMTGAVTEKDFDLFVGGAIVGQVVQKGSGEPIEDAQIVAIVAQGGMGPPAARKDGQDPRGSVGRTRSDEKGHFRMDDLLPAPVMSAQVKAPGYVSHNAMMWTGGGWGKVEAGGELDVIVELAPGGIIEGVVTEEAGGKPIHGAEVTVIPRRDMWRVFATGSPHVETNVEGRYVLSGIEPGKYGIVATAPGYTATDPLADAGEVEVGAAGETVRHDVALSRAGSVSGVVTDSKGIPVAGAKVRTRQSRGGGGRGRNLTAMLPGGSVADLTDQQGRFLLEGVGAEREWFLEAEAEDLVPAESDPFRLQAGQKKKIDLVLTGGGHLDGRVVDDNGRFVPGARVRVGHLPADRAGRGRLVSWEVDGYLDTEVHVTDEEGHFRVENIPPGIALVKATKDGYVTFYRRDLTIEADETRENYVVTLSKGDVMEGSVRGAGGQPLEGAFVAVTSNVPGEDSDEDDEEQETDDEIEPGMFSQTEKDGTFKIEDIPPGVYNVVVWFAPGHLNWGRDRNERAIRRGISSSATHVDFQLEASPTPQFGPGGGR